MQLKSLLLCLYVSLCSMAATAGGGHDHGHSHFQAPVDQTTATVNATEIVTALVERNRLEESWASITPISVEKKVFVGNQEWVAVFVNDNIIDTDKRKLYVYLTLGGDYIAANFTGE